MRGVLWESIHQTLIARQHEGKVCAKTTFICMMTIIAHQKQSTGICSILCLKAETAHRSRTEEACSMLPQSKLRKPIHADSSGIYLFVISGNVLASWTKWRRRRITQTEGHIGLYASIRQLLGILRTYGALRFVNRAH